MPATPTEKPSVLTIERLTPMEVSPQKVKIIIARLLPPFLDVSPPPGGYGDSPEERLTAYLRRLLEIYPEAEVTIYDSSNVQRLLQPEEVEISDMDLKRLQKIFPDMNLEMNFMGNMRPMSPPEIAERIFERLSEEDIRDRIRSIYESLGRGTISREDTELYDRLWLLIWRRFLGRIVPDAEDPERRESQTRLFGIFFSCFWCGDVASFSSPEGGDDVLMANLAGLRQSSFLDGSRRLIFYPYFLNALTNFPTFRAPSATLLTDKEREAKMIELANVVSNIVEMMLVNINPAQIRRRGRDGVLAATKIGVEDVFLAAAYGGWKLSPELCEKIMEALVSFYPSLFKPGSVVLASNLVDLLSQGIS